MSNLVILMFHLASSDLVGTSRGEKKFPTTASLGDVVQKFNLDPGNLVLSEVTDGDYM